MKLIAILLGFSVTVFAGDDRGNGGGGMICKNAIGTTLSVVTLDVYEAKIRFGENYQVSLGDKYLDPVKKALFALDRLVRFSPQKADHYRKLVQSFMDEAFFLPPGNRLVEVPDADNISIPEGCELGQLAVQRKPEFPEDHYYTIDSDLWHAMDNDNRAMLILHEIFYREGLSHGHTNSRKTRYFNSIVASEQLNSYTLKSYLKLLTLAELPEFDFQGFEFMVASGTYSFYENNDWELAYALANRAKPHPEYYFDGFIYLSRDGKRIAGTMDRPYIAKEAGLCFSSHPPGLNRVPLLVDREKNQVMGHLCHQFTSTLNGKPITWTGFAATDGRRLTMGCSTNTDVLGNLSNLYLELEIRDGSLISAGDLGISQCSNTDAVLCSGLLSPYPASAD